MKLPYEILVQGYFAESEVVVDWTSDVMKRNPETKRLIEETWSAREADARKNNQLLFPGTLSRLADWSEASSTLNIVFGFADYKDLDSALERAASRPCWAATSSGSRATAC